MSTDNKQRGKEVARPERTTAAVPVGTPNPQGKGQVGFLLDWDYSAPRGVTAKPSGRILADYFTSILVLSADFKFKPVFEKNYYLYRHEPRWILSMISPDEWDSAEKRRAFVGTCVLHADSTWSIAPSTNLSKTGHVAEAVADVYDSFVEKLDSETVLEQDLPFYEASLPYYQRLFASALSRSTRTTLFLSDRRETSCRHWQSLLPSQRNILLERRR